MEEIASHIMDLVTNSISAKAKNIEVSVIEDRAAALLEVRVKDDGKGMDRESAKRIQDPFFSTKTGRKVGLGVPLLKGTAETTDGAFSLTSELGEGTEVTASFRLTHPDLPVLGNLRDTVLVLIVGNPDVDFVFSYKKDDKTFLLDTKEVKKLLGDVPVNHPEVIRFLSKYLDENL